MMQKELHDWRSQYNQLSKQLEKEQMYNPCNCIIWKIHYICYYILLIIFRRTQEIIDPMHMTLREIDNNIQDQLNKIYQAKARIIKNNQKIQRLLNGDV